ncbi:LysR family transcriptional regulator [Duganella sp. LX20W]|uniref:LysR family transcriptional regulator n=1 Tax=Rugamonas brunnea TaxID=2758569 RepID=A0A7W2ESD8_9BURK|nr:LysR family transcriptional regulator [Rugamonas brunnea]MBA5637640.1 LysR family transcriptional regulator [Rugamonas brunnea]
MDLKRLRHAIALAEELNFARAAERVHLSQPALSRSIQTLEEELGLPLFDRDNRNVKLTTAGAVFMERARKLTFQMRNLERDMGLIRDAEMGVVAFGVGPLPTASMLPQLVRHVRQTRPGLAMRVSSNNWRNLLVNLKAEQIEFFIADARDILPDPDLSITPISRQHGRFMVRAGHPLLARPERTLADTLPYGFASLLLPLAMKALFRQVLRLAPEAPLPVMFECDNMHILKEVTLEDDVILLATEAAVANEVASGTLAPLDFPGLPPMYAEIGAVQLVGRTLSPAARLVLERLHDIAATAPGSTVFRDGRYQAMA